MAERRMFAKTIIDSDAFLDMPLSTQALYFHLSMRADDEGFINNHKKIARMVGASEDEMKVLIAKNFILIFESGVIVIKHWKLHNYIRADRIRNTNHTEERATLGVKENGSYTMSDTCQSDVSIGKDSIGEVRLGKDSIDKPKPFTFSLSRDTHFSNVSEEYKQNLKDKINNYNGNLSYEDFEMSLLAKSSYKYKNFWLTYQKWNKNAQTRQPMQSFKQQDAQKTDNALDAFLDAREKGFDLRNVNSETVQDVEVIER